MHNNNHNNNKDTMLSRSFSQKKKQHSSRSSLEKKTRYFQPCFFSFKDKKLVGRGCCVS